MAREMLTVEEVIQEARRRLLHQRAALRPDETHGQETGLRRDFAPGARHQLELAS